MTSRSYRDRLIAGGVVGVLIVSVYVYTAFWMGSSPELTEPFTVPDGFEVAEAVLPGLVSYPMFATFDDSGNLFVFESSGHTEGTEEILENPNFRILLLRDSDGDGVFDQRTVFADKLPFPMGGTFLQGSLYVTAVPDLFKFTDRDGDGVADEKELLLSGWKLNHNAAILSGPFLGPDGWLYMADARRGFDVITREGQLLSGKGARIWRCLPDGSCLESFSGGGFDNAVELAFTPSGEVFGTMTYFVDPQGGYRDALMHWVEGGVYPKPHSVIEEDGLALTGDLMPVMVKMARVSPSGLMRYEGDFWGDSFRGNLFHAQFNTGRIVRSVLQPEGATYTSTESYFLESTLPDFHPTDVLQDADGCLLMLNTGGWFIAGCPLSRTAKPDVNGGIYRIRSVAAAPVHDPYGNGLAWEQMDTDALVEVMSSSGPFLRKRAQEAVLKQGAAAAPFLQRQLLAHTNPEVRTQLVFLLYRLNEMDLLAEAAKDPSAEVRAAFCRVMGLAPWAGAVGSLVDLLRDPSDMVRRQAATALGRMGLPGTSGPLLAVLEENGDRFVRHAVIYSLIQLGEGSVLKQALNHAHTGVRTAALMALEQQPNGVLTRQHLTAFLESESAELQNAARWVLGRHPEWSDLAMRLFERADPDELESFRSLFGVFARQEVFQKGFAVLLAQKRADANAGEAYLALMQSASVQPFPEVWKPYLGYWLQQSESTLLRSKVLDLVLSAGLRGMEPYLRPLADPQVSFPFRVRVLQALVRDGYRPETRELRRLMGDLGQGAEGREMTQAIQLLGLVGMEEEDMVYLVDSIMPRMEERYVPYVLPVFEELESERVAGTLIGFLASIPSLWDKLSPEQVKGLFSGDLPGVADRVTELLAQIGKQREARLEKLDQLESQLTGGDVLAGRTLFYGEAGCADCHAVAGEGSVFGPDLSNVGEIRSRHDLLEALVYPSASFAREYESVEVRSESGTWLGIIKVRDGGELVLEIGPGVFRRIAEDSILEIRESEQSLMPAGWEDRLTLGQISDLMAFLQSLPDGLTAAR